MPKYAYAPLSVDERRRKPHDNVSDQERDESLLNERMPMCVGICVLLAIVYVLSRAGAPPAVTVPSTTPVVSATVPVVSSASSVVPPPGTPAFSFQPPPSVPPPPLPAAVPVTPPVVPVTTPVVPVTTPVVPATTPVVPAATTTTTTTAVTTPAIRGAPQSSNPQDPQCSCDGLVDPQNIDMGALRQAAFARSPPHIIECAQAEAGESQSACHLPSAKRFEALKQKGATLWMTGCSGAGKTTIATKLEEVLVKMYGKHVYRLDGDNLRTGLNRDLTFTSADRAESVRRTGELATLFADAGIITLVGLISPYREDRDLVRKRHEDSGIPFYEIFLDVPIDELKNRDPKGQYARVESGELKHFTCIDDPYEEPLQPEITLKTHELTIEQSAAILFHRLHTDGILEGAPKLSAPGLPNPDGDEIVDLHVPDNLKAERQREAEGLVKVLLTDIDLNWLQVIGEGWASPLKGFMREGALVQTLHFNSILVDPFNLTGNSGMHTRQTDFTNFQERPPPTRVSMSVPITLSITDFTKRNIEMAKQGAVALVTRSGQTVAILRDPEIYDNRKEEIITRMYGAMDVGHPYIKNILSGGDFLLGGEIELLDRIRYNDGLDQWRKTAKELMDEFQAKGADTVYAFQTRNPTHAGHAYLMRSAGEDLKAKGYSNPILWLSPLGGWTKEDDVPLNVRIRQHEEVLNAGMTHPGGLDPEKTVMAIWPSPMVYAGPTEVQFHAKSRRSAGASYFVVGRDPAGMKRSDRDEDLYHGDHGRYVLQYSPGLGDMKLLSFVKVMYDISDNVMKTPDPARMDDFISISGTKMRLLARNGAVPCAPDNIPTDLVEANCIPSGFMVPKGWEGVVDYYKNVDQKDKWIPWSQPRVEPYRASDTTTVGQFLTTNFRLTHNTYPSLWHDVPLAPETNEANIINFITEIPMYNAAKMEVSKEEPGNPIMQDTNKDGSPRFYSYGVPFFNYGLVPQTWEDPHLKSPEGYGGDNDPLDVMEVGTRPLAMGSITPCRVLGSLELIDDGETDHKIICISTSDPLAATVHTMADFEARRPGYLDGLKDWLKRYKTSDGKAENSLAQEEPTSVEQAMGIIKECSERWMALCNPTGATTTTTPAAPSGGFSLYGSATSSATTTTATTASVVSTDNEFGFSLEAKSCRGS
mmetsp:Transcript_32281/g.39632  ORF Transcript_32281/g.39632 Transcript_32281/m.39632 type:complete len:1156 (+) Transcript_32281:158-3625(+)